MIRKIGLFHFEQPKINLFFFLFEVGFKGCAAVNNLIDSYLQSSKDYDACHFKKESYLVFKCSSARIVTKANSCDDCANPIRREDIELPEI